MDEILGGARRTIPVMIAALVFVTVSASKADVVGPGDRVFTIGEARVMDKSEVLAVVEKGKALTAERVNGEWVLVSVDRDGTTVSGWIQSKYLVKGEPGLRLAQVETKDLPSRQSTIWTLERGLAQTIQIKSNNPVDCFLLSEEGKASYDWFLQNGSGQATVYNHHYNVREVTIRWEPPDDGQYYFIVDNTAFPDAGARGTYGTRYTVMYWFDDP